MGKKAVVIGAGKGGLSCAIRLRNKGYEQKFSAFQGATFGLQPTLLQSNHLRPQSKCLSCEGLYFTGSSTHPGAGVPIALEGGKICAGEVIKDYGTK